MTTIPIDLADALSPLVRYLADYPEEASSLAAALAQIEENDRWWDRKTMRGHVATSMLVLNPAKTHFLEIFHNVYQRWVPPGGHYEGSGSLWDSGCREVEEETGVTGLVQLYPGAETIPLDIDSHHIAENTQKQEGAHFHHDYVFAAIAQGNTILRPQLEEVAEARWTPLGMLERVSDARAVRWATKLATAMQQYPSPR